MSEKIGDKISRVVKEDSMGIRRRIKNNLVVYDLTNEEYDRFINFVKTEVPSKQGYHAINLLLDSYDKFKYSDKLIKKLESENEELKSQLANMPDEEPPKKKWIGSD